MLGSLLLGFSVAGYGSTTADALTLSHAVALALAHQPSVAAQHDEADAASRLADAGKAVFFPHLGLQAGELFNRTENGIPDFVSANGQREIKGQVVLDQKLYDPQATAAIGATRAEAEFAHYRALQNRFAVAGTVARTYYKLQTQEATIAIWKSAISESQADRNAARRGLRAGIRTRLDLLRAQAALRQARQGLTQAEIERATSTRLLMLITGLPVLPPLVVAAPIGNDFALPSLPHFQTAALQKQPALGMAKSRQRRAAALLAAAHGKRLPRAQLQVAYGWDALGSPWGTRPGWSAGISVSMPLFDGGELRDRTDAARLKLNATKERALQTRLDVRASLNTVWGDAKAALDACKTAKDLAQVKKRIWQISKEGYRAGQLSSLDLFLAQRGWIHSQQVELTDAARLRLALVQLQLLAGQLPTDNNQ